MLAFQRKYRQIALSHQHDTDWSTWKSEEEFRSLMGLGESIRAALKHSP